MTRAVLTILALTVLCAVPLQAQILEVRGQVLDADSGRPLRGARASLEVAGQAIASTLVDEDGRFSLSTETGRATLVIRGLGFADHAENLGPGTTDLGIVRIAPRPIAISGLTVSGDRTCQGDPKELASGFAAISAVLDDFRAIAAQDARADLVYVLEVVSMRRELNHRNQLVFPRDTLRVRAPAAFSGADNLSLLAEGFAVALNDSVNDYRSPTPALLGDDQFLDYACFSSAEETPHRIEFWPRYETEKVGIRGTVLLQQGRPERVEYSYTNLKRFIEIHELPWLEMYFAEVSGVWPVPMRPLDYRDSHHGGYLVFGEVADQPLMTLEWEVAGAALGFRAYGGIDNPREIRPRSSSWPTTGRLLALVPIR